MSEPTQSVTNGQGLVVQVAPSDGPSLLSWACGGVVAYVTHRWPEFGGAIITGLVALFGSHLVVKK